MHYSCGSRIIQFASAQTPNQSDWRHRPPGGIPASTSLMTGKHVTLFRGISDADVTHLASTEDCRISVCSNEL
jgi:hypothetical protein